MNVYDAKFYQEYDSVTSRSARAVIPHILETIGPHSVLDVGCGGGAWVEVFAAHGVESYGIDGPWAEAGTRIPDRLVTFDFLKARAPYDPKLPRARFDLVTTFEFLEHIDPDKAPAIVAFLTRLTDVVIAGAAIPGQGGRYHVNEQWPAYWQALFAKEGFVAYDFLRPLTWDLESAEPWYVQNAIGYFRGAPPAHVVERATAAALARLQAPAALVHPRMFAYARDPYHQAIWSQVQGLSRSLARKVALKLRGG